MREDARDDATIVEAYREIVGPWPAAPKKPPPYLGEHIRLDGDGPPPLEAHGIDIWLDAVQWAAAVDEGATWNRETTPERAIRAWQDRVAIAAPQIVVGAYNEDRSRGDHAATTASSRGSNATRRHLLHLDRILITA